MKSKIKWLLMGALLGLVGMFAVAASISFNLPVPVTWSTSNGTNAFGLDSSANPNITIAGTNYSGITTNFVLTNGATVKVKGGIITSVQ